MATIKKYESGIQFCAERLMVINAALDAVGKMGDAGGGQEALVRLANLWSVDLVDGEFEVEEPDTKLTEVDLEAALKDGPLTIGQIAKAEKVTVAEVRPALKQALKDGKIGYEGEHRSRKYSWGSVN